MCNKTEGDYQREQRARIAELEAEVKEQAKAIKAFHDVRVIDLNELADTRGRMVLLRKERDDLRATVEKVRGYLADAILSGDTTEYRENCTESE
jgi:hypothetical protein